MEEQLIEFVRGNRVLYDKRHKCYKNIYLRDQKFQELSTKVNIPAEKLKARWRTLRDKFYKDLKQKPSGSGIDSPHKKWKWTDHLMFLKDVEMDNLNTHGNYENVEELLLDDTTSLSGTLSDNSSMSNVSASQDSPMPKKTPNKRQIHELFENANKDFRRVASIAENALADNGQGQKSAITLFVESLAVQANQANLSFMEASAANDAIFS